MSYRNNDTMDAGLVGKRAQTQRASVRRGTLQTVNANEVADVSVSDTDGGDALTRPMDVAQGVGYVARPAEASRVQVVVVNVAGSSDNPVGAGYLDWSRDKVLEAAGIGAEVTDFVVIYNSTRAVQILPGGEILIGAPGGTSKPLALKADVDAVNSRVATLESTYNSHIHPATIGVISPTAQQSATSADVDGTAYIRETQ